MLFLKISVLYNFSFPQYFIYLFFLRRNRVKYFFCNIIGYEIDQVSGTSLIFKNIFCTTVTVLRLHASPILLSDLYLFYV